MDEWVTIQSFECVCLIFLNNTLSSLQLLPSMVSMEAKLNLKDMVQLLFRWIFVRLVSFVDVTILDDKSSIVVVQVDPYPKKQSRSGFPHSF